MRTQQRPVRAGAPPQHRHRTGRPTTIAEHRNQIRWLDEAELMDWMCGVRLDVLRGIFAPLIQNAEPRVRDKLLGVVKTTLQSANDKLHALLRDHAPVVSAYDPKSAAALP